MLAAAGAVDCSASNSSIVAEPASSSVKPACVTVGSETASVSGAEGWACATSSTQASSAAKGASSSAACLTCESIEKLAHDFPRSAVYVQVVLSSTPSVEGTPSSAPSMSFSAAATAAASPP
jgi:hypothetical protein